MAHINFRKILFITFLLPFINSASAANDISKLLGRSSEDSNQLFNEVLQKVKDNYVEELENKQLIEHAVNGMLSSLDPHSSFLNEKDLKAMRIATKGEFGGIGLEVTMDKGFLKVISPYEDAPAFKSGIKAGDYITMIDGIVVKGMNLSEAVEKIHGKPKTKVNLSIFRETTNERLEFAVTRDLIKIIPVKSKLIANDIAFIKITSFNETTASLVKTAFLKLKEKPLRGIIIDLRWNPGGLLDQAKEVAELFLDEGVIVITKGRVKSSNQVLKANGADISEGLPIVILMNNGSASASEIVAGALQDNKRGLVVGTKSFGKGSVQTIIPLGGDHAIKLTTSRYYTPLGKAIQANGITPDVVVEEATLTPTKKLNNIITEKSLVNHLQQGENLNNKTTDTQFLESISSENINDYQLLRAIDVVKGMALYSERLFN